MSGKDLARILVPIGAILALVFLSNGASGSLIGVGLIVIIFASAFFWRWLGPETIVEDRSTETQETRKLNVVALLLGLLSSSVVAYINYEFVKYDGIDFSLLGAPFLIPLGPFALGIISTWGFSIGLARERLQTVAKDGFIFAAIAGLSLLFSYVFLYSSFSPDSISKFLATYWASGPIWLSPPGTSRGGAIGTPAWSFATPLVQVIGYGMGGLVAFFRTHPRLGRP